MLNPMQIQALVPWHDVRFTPESGHWLSASKADIAALVIIIRAGGLQGLHQLARYFFSSTRA
jgi:hypothetical protein